jgi:hypothetical protein
LSECQTTIVGRNTTMRQDLQAARTQASANPLEQGAVLKHAAGDGHRIDGMGSGNLCAQFDNRVGESDMKSRADSRRRRGIGKVRKQLLPHRRRVQHPKSIVLVKPKR